MANSREIRQAVANATASLEWAQEQAMKSHRPTKERTAIDIALAETRRALAQFVKPAK